MGEKLKKLAEYIKTLAYLAVTVYAIYGYVNLDSILTRIADKLQPYVNTQIEESVKEYVPSSVKVALESDDVVIKIDSNQFRQFAIMLNNNKNEILEATEVTSERMAKLVLHDFLVVEKEVIDPVTGETLYIRGILIGKDELGRDDWTFRITKTKKDQ